LSATFSGIGRAGQERRRILTTDATAEPSSFDTSVAHPARVYDYLLGGKENYGADREAAEGLIAISPSVLPSVRANRAFLRRAVEYLTAEAGIRQFLDIGTGLPTADNTHQVAQGIAPESRVVYVDNDPIVLAHARALLTSKPEGATAYIDADLRDTDGILRAAAATLDFSKPIAVMLLCIMQYVPDAARPHEIVARLMDAVQAGSYLTMSDTTRDIQTEEMIAGAAQYNARLGPNVFTPRTGEEYAAFFDGLELVEPGLVPLPQWRALADPAQVIPMYAAMGRKP
jgi:O-methyltransferase involved in polyketide biosynthesis